MTGREYWPTAVNVLEAAQTSDPGLRARLLNTIHELAEDNHALTLPGEALRRIAQAIAAEDRDVDWSEPGVTKLFRNPASITDLEIQAIRAAIAAEEENFNAVHEEARIKLKPHIKDAGGMKRWRTPASYIEEFWTSQENIGPYIQALWTSWGLVGDAPLDRLLMQDTWRLYFDGWGAANYARAVEHPQRGKVQYSDLTQLSYLGPFYDRVLVTEDKEFRDLGNAILRGRYGLAEIVSFDMLVA